MYIQSISHNNLSGYITNKKVKQYFVLGATLTVFEIGITRSIVPLSH